MLSLSQTFTKQSISHHTSVWWVSHPHTHTCSVHDDHDHATHWWPPFIASITGPRPDTKECIISSGGCETKCSANRVATSSPAYQISPSSSSRTSFTAFHEAPFSEAQMLIIIISSNSATHYASHAGDLEIVQQVKLTSAKKEIFWGQIALAVVNGDQLKLLRETPSPDYDDYVACWSHIRSACAQLSADGTVTLSDFPPSSSRVASSSLKYGSMHSLVLHHCSDCTNGSHSLWIEIVT